MISHSVILRRIWKLKVIVYPYMTSDSLINEYVFIHLLYIALQFETSYINVDARAYSLIEHCDTYFPGWDEPPLTRETIDTKAAQVHFV